MSKLEVDAIEPQSGTSLTLGASGDTITIPSGATITNSGTATGFGGGGMYKNIVINGDMSIAQRGTSTASITTSGYYTADRFQQQVNNMGTWTQTQSTDVPSGQGFAKSLQIDCTTADASPAASDFVLLLQKFEGQMLQYLKKGTASAESLTLSFWVKSNKTGTYICEFNDSDNTRSISKSYTINLANTWEKKTITIPGDTTGAFDNDNGQSFLLFFWLGAGTDWTSGTLNTSWGSTVNANRVVGQVNLADNTANEWFITGVQLEAGTTASDFEFLPFDVNLRRCIRYYTTSQGVANWGDFTTGADNGIYFGRVGAFSNQPCNHRFPVRMRTTPTITLYSLIGTSGSVSDTGTTAGTHVADDTASPARISESGLGYLTGCSAGSGDGYAFQYEADAEI